MVKGYVEISADDKVAELKNVVFPVFVLPMRPILIGMDKRPSPNYLSLLYYSTFHLLIYSMKFCNSEIIHWISDASSVEISSSHLS